MYGQLFRHGIIISQDMPDTVTLLIPGIQVTFTSPGNIHPAIPVA
jgi:hypothetical protein